MRELVMELALALRKEVLPLLGAHASRRHLNYGEGGDITFAIDEVAEAFLENYLKEKRPDVAFYSEDRGLVKPAEEISTVLIVDPIDGTRPALAGLESSCVSVAAVPLAAEADIHSLTMVDVDVGCIVELKAGTVFIASRGAGVEIRGHDLGVEAPVLSPESDLSKLFWSLGFRGRPARVLIETLGDLIDISSVGGSVFDLGSATYDMTRVLTGQLDLYIDVGSRIIDEIPALRQEFERVGDGSVLNNSPYDLAAAVLVLEEGGAVVTDACGESLAPRKLIGSGHEFQMSCIAAANRDLHGQVLEQINLGIEKCSVRYSGSSY